MSAIARRLTAEVQKVLTPDLLKREWAQNPRTPLTGHCYAATEAMYHMLGGKAAGYKAVGAQHEGGSHWWLQGPRGEVIDPTAGQFKTPVPYARGVGRGFLTREPSARAREIIQRVRSRRGWGKAA